MAAQRVTLVYSPMRGGEGELSVNSRSMLQIMGALSAFVDMPAAHLADRSATEAFASRPGEAPEQVPARIHSGTEKPTNVYAAVQYRDHWFWVDQSDWQTKRAMTAVMFFFTLADTGSPDRLPLITIPAQ